MKTNFLHCLLLFAIVFPAPAAERVALVIGNGAYAHVPKLDNPANDARAVAAMLQTGGYEVTEVVDGTVKEMSVALRTFALAGRTAATAIFYYAGHGFEVAGQNYLAPVDAELAVDDALTDDALDAALGFALDDETMSLESVLAEMRKQVPGLKLVILDCCRDNPFARTRSWAKSRSGGGGLAQVTEAQLPEGSMLVFSGEPGQQVPDGTGNHSPFTEAFLNEMQSAAGAPMLTVFTGVATKVKGRQKPWIKFDGTGQSLHAFSIVALMPGKVGVKVEDASSTGEMAKLRADLATAEAEREAASKGNTVEMARLQRELEEARAKMAAASSMPPASVPSSVPSPPVTMTRPEPVTPPAFSASRGIVSGQPFRSAVETDFVWVEPGTFTMGTSAPEKIALLSSAAGGTPEETEDEKPHQVIITRGYWVGAHEVTIRDFLRFLNESGQFEADWVKFGDNFTPIESSGSAFAMRSGQGPTWGDENLPMVMVSWEGAMSYCAWLNEKEKARLPAGYRFSLPTEAEWEKAARAGTTTMTYAGDLDIVDGGNSLLLNSIAWYGGNSGLEHDNGSDLKEWSGEQSAGTHPVGLKSPNGLGAYDMIGNVREWCSDRYGLYGDTATDPTGAKSGAARGSMRSNSGENRVYRGGSWIDNARYCRSASRAGFSVWVGLSVQYSYLGFRPALSSMPSK